MNNFFSKRPLLLFFFLTGLILLGPYGDSRVSAIDRNTYKNLKTFTEILDMVEKNYVEPVDSDKLMQGAINGLMKSLDPHSSFMTAEMYKELEVETRGSFGGIGIEITILKDVLTVVSPIEDTPAYNAGVKAGDQIIRIDGKPTKDITIMEAVNKLRGPKDTNVTITIMREGMAKPKDIVDHPQYHKDQEHQVKDLRRPCRIYPDLLVSGTDGGRPEKGPPGDRGEGPPPEGHRGRYEEQPGRSPEPVRGGVGRLFEEGCHRLHAGQIQEHGEQIHGKGRR